MEDMLWFVFVICLMFILNGLFMPYFLRLNRNYLGNKFPIKEGILPEWVLWILYYVLLALVLATFAQFTIW